MPTTEWLNKYEAIKDKLTCKDDLEAHFTEKVIGNMAVDVLDIGTVHFPTGQIFACDPLVELEDTLPFLQTIPAGTYPVKICVVPSEQYGDRYACVKVEVSQEKPVRYELGMVGNEDLDEELGEDEYFGFGVDAGMGCVADIQTQAAFKAYWAKRLEEDPDIDPYNDLFCDLLEENAQAHPKYQGDCGDWLNWTVPDTDCNLPIFASGWGDGYYPVYFGYDAKGDTDWCGVRSGRDYHKFDEMKLTPGQCTVVSAPLIEESPLCIECRVKEIVSLGSHDMFIADVVNVRADDRNLNPETGKLELAEANPLVYVHGGYYGLGEKIGKFGWSVEKKKS